MYSERTASVRRKLQELTVDGMLFSNFFSIFYLTGLKTLTPEEREAFVFITPRNSYFFTDGRYLDDQLLKQISSVGATFKLIEMGKGLSFHLKAIIQQENLQKLGFEEEDLKYIEYSLLQKRLEREMAPVVDLVTKLREIKSVEEIEMIREACLRTDQCLEELLPQIHVGITEKEFGWKMEKWIREHGYELAFEPIVAVNEHAAIPHYSTRTGNGQVTSSSVILLDFGVRYQNYNADITRMVFVGEQPDEVVNIYNGLASAQEKAIQSIQKGKNLEEIDLLCREELQKHGLPDFSHSTGHGIGLEVHENPKVSKHSKDIVTPGQVFTIEPGVYLPKKFGMRIEDTICIDENYKAVPLTTFSKTFHQIHA